ncbi:MAG: ABC transporter permease [Clostridiales bacterium]|jgi:spermidine/putrescine transport system permease protein|nr:ABC transporter permease [Clostridiales bacterium]
MKSFVRMSYPYILWIAVFIVAPMIMILLYALTRTGNGTLTFQFTLENFSRFFSDPDFLRVLWTSLRIALITTVFCILIGYPAALFIANLPEKRQTLMILLLTLPMWINMLLKTYAWRGILMNFDLESEAKVFIGMVYDFLPYMVIQIHTAISKLDRDLLVASYDLGANRWQSFLKVTLPLSVPGIISGITLVFLPAVSSFVIPKLLGGGNYVLIGNLIEKYFLVAGDWNFGSAISLIMALIIIASMYLTKKIDRNAEED